jgi:Fe2+ transport system protein FeoA
MSHQPRPRFHRVGHERGLSTLELPLTKLKNSESGTITSIQLTPGKGQRHGQGHGSWGFARRLIDMGLTPGAQVTVVKSAPFHGPLEVLVRGSRLALGRGMAEKIVVEVDR